MKVMAQIAMVMNLDKCIGCHTCSVTCKQAWTNREGTEYMWFNNVETRPGVGYPRGWEDQERWRRLEAHPFRETGPLSGRAFGHLRQDFRQSEPARQEGLLRAVDLRIRPTTGVPIDSAHSHCPSKISPHG